MALAGSLHAAPLAETWQTGYAGQDATGPHVLGYWRFNPDAPLADSSGRGSALTLEGAVAASEGKRDGALESFPGWPVEDKRHAALAATKPALSPKGAFTIEMWIKPKPQLDSGLTPVLVDKKYVAHTDYQWRLTAADKGGARRMQVTLGFGDGSETFHSEPFTPGTEWQHVAFTYDGAGAVRFYRDGAPLGGAVKPGRGAIAPGKHVLSIGDRVGSNYAGFPGFIDEVRLCDGVLEFRPVAVEFSAARKTWRRMEKAPPFRVLVRNLRKVPARDLKLRVSLEGLGARNFEVPELAAGAEHAVDYPFDTALRPDAYRLQAHLEMPGEMPFTSDESTVITLVARPLSKMPVVMWGLGSPQSVKEEMPRLKDLGFTHCLGGGANYDAIWTAKKPAPPGTEKQIAEMAEMFDLALAKELGIALALSPGGWLKERKELQRVDRQGKPYGVAARCKCRAAGPRGVLFQRGGKHGAGLRRLSRVAGGADQQRDARQLASELFRIRSRGLPQVLRCGYSSGGDDEERRRMGEAEGSSRRSHHPRRSSAAEILPLVLDSGRWLERAAHRHASRPSLDRPGRCLDVVRPGDSRAEPRRQRRRSGCARAVDVHQSRSGAHRLLHR